MTTKHLSFLINNQATSRNYHVLANIFYIVLFLLLFLGLKTYISFSWSGLQIWNKWKRLMRMLHATENIKKGTISFPKLPIYTCTLPIKRRRNFKSVTFQNNKTFKNTLIWRNIEIFSFFSIRCSTGIFNFRLLK